MTVNFSQAPALDCSYAVLGHSGKEDRSGGGGLPVCWSLRPSGGRDPGQPGQRQAALAAVRAMTQGRVMESGKQSGALPSGQWSVNTKEGGVEGRAGVKAVLPSVMFLTSLSHWLRKPLHTPSLVLPLV